MYAILRDNLNKQMDMIGIYVHVDHFTLSLCGCLFDDGSQANGYRVGQYWPSIFGAPNNVVLAAIDYVSAVRILH